MRRNPRADPAQKDATDDVLHVMHVATCGLEAEKHSNADVADREESHWQIEIDAMPQFGVQIAGGISGAGHGDGGMTAGERQASHSQLVLTARSASRFLDESLGAIWLTQ